MVGIKQRHSKRVSFIMQKGKQMKLRKGIYQTNKVIMLRSHFSEDNVQAMSLEFIHIEKSVRGGYLGFIQNGISKHEVIIKNDQAAHLVRVESRL